LSADDVDAAVGHELDGGGLSAVVARHADIDAPDLTIAGGCGALRLDGVTDDEAVYVEGGEDFLELSAGLGLDALAIEPRPDGAILLDEVLGDRAFGAHPSACVAI
jgi:hypothetical protein